MSLQSCEFLEREVVGEAYLPTDRQTVTGSE